jgi:subtilase family serine protease
MNQTTVSGASIGRFARTALPAMLCMLASGYVAAAPHVIVKWAAGTDAATPPSYAYCVKTFGSPCYSPKEMRTAYGLDGLIDAGMVGAGQTIVIIDSYGSPTIAADLRVFDAGFGLPDPPSFKVLAPLGTVPWNPTLYPDQPGWASEVTLDVEWAHAMAPGAAIVLLTSPVDETEGVQGMPEFLALEQYALDHHLGKIISQSWSATENTFFYDAAGPQGPQVIADFEVFYARAVAENVTLLAGAGDTGSSNVETDGVTYYPFPTVGFPASSPFVTAVGGTTLTATASGKYVSETVWNNLGYAAGGGGISQIFQEPEYQETSLPGKVQAELRHMRGLPDVSYNADCYNVISIYASFPGSGGADWYGICGTSEGSPQWAGIVADLNQYAGRPLGFLNPALYALGGAGHFSSIGRDITQGNNALLDVPGATAPGYYATRGWDLATGWGSPNLVELPYHVFGFLEYDPPAASPAAVIPPRGPPVARSRSQFPANER